MTTIIKQNQNNTIFNSFLNSVVNAFDGWMKGIMNCQDYYNFEKCLVKISNDMTQQFVKTLIETADTMICAEYKADDWSIKGFEQRTLVTKIGTLNFKRRRIIKEGEKSFLPFDHYFGITKRTRISDMMKENILQLASSMTYRAAAQSMSVCHEVEISHQLVHNVVQAYGPLAAEYHQKRQKEQVTLETPDILYIEGDGVQVGANAPGKRHEIHNVVIHQGVVHHGKRHVLKEPLVFTSLISSKAAMAQADEYLQNHFDLRQTLVISNSDGGSGYRKENFSWFLGNVGRHEHLLDRYHVYQKIEDRLRNVVPPVK